MKRAWLILLLVIPISIRAADPPQSASIDISALWTHTIVAADTVAASAYRDSVYSPWFLMPKGSKFFFTAIADGSTRTMKPRNLRDSAWARDSVNINIQIATKDTSIILATSNLGVLIPGSADLDTAIMYAATLARDTTCMRAAKIRAFWVVKDSAAATRPAILGQRYGKMLILQMNAQL